jgi:hypothetical protein
LVHDVDDGLLEAFPFLVAFCVVGRVSGFV